MRPRLSISMEVHFIWTRISIILKILSHPVYTVLMLSWEMRILSDIVIRLSRFLPDNTLVVEVAAGEANKTIETCHTIWQKLLAERVDRRALALLLGGGVIGDMGGLAVSTYKRGMDFVHIPLL